MSSGVTPYLGTPWGLYTQQQVLMQMCLLNMIFVGADIQDAPTVTTYLGYMMNYYNIVWPLIEAESL